MGALHGRLKRARLSLARQKNHQDVQTHLSLDPVWGWGSDPGTGEVSIGFEWSGQQRQKDTGGTGVAVKEHL